MIFVVFLYFKGISSIFLSQNVPILDGFVKVTFSAKVFKIRSSILHEEGNSEKNIDGDFEDFETSSFDFGCVNYVL